MNAGGFEVAPFEAGAIAWLAVPEIAFRGEVLEFIDEPARERYATRWEELQLFVADLISAIRETSDERVR